MSEILVLYFSRHGSTETLARAVVLGIESVTGMQARLRTVPNVSSETETIADSIPASGPPYATLDDLRECAGLVLGCPTRFGNMAAAMKYFIDSTSPLWLSGDLVNKPAGVFTSSSSLHGGQESTLLSMMLPLFHHGMILVGIPFTEAELGTTTQGGTPYGASHVTGANNDFPVSDTEQLLAKKLGTRIATIASAQIKAGNV